MAVVSVATSAWRWPVLGNVIGGSTTTRRRAGPRRSMWAGMTGQPKRSAKAAAAGAVMAVWPKRFPTEASALPYVADERKLANFVYAGRLGNGNAASGDVFKFRGRGIIQVTGRSNYASAGVALGLKLVEDPDLLLVPANAAMSAAWYWSSRGLNALADDRTDDNDLEDFTEITRRINGGTVGLKDRLAALNLVQENLA